MMINSRLSGCVLWIAFACLLGAGVSVAAAGDKTPTSRPDISPQQVRRWLVNQEETYGEGWTNSDRLRRQPKPSTGEPRQIFERLAREIRWLPNNLTRGLGKWTMHLPAAEDNKVRQQVIDLRMLVTKVDALPINLLNAKDPTQRGLAVWIFGLSDSPKKVLAAFNCLNDNAVSTIAYTPFSASWFGTDPRKKKITKCTVAGFASKAMRSRLVCSGVLASRPFALATASPRYWNSIEDIHVLPSEWVYQFRRAKVWGKDIAATKKELLKRVKPSHVGIVVASVRAFDFNQDIYTDEEVIRALIKSGDKKLLRGILEQTLQRPGISLKQGPNSKYQREVRMVLLRAAPKVLSKNDAGWVHDAAFKSVGWIRPYYIIASAKLDPDRGVAWLKRGVRNNRDQLARSQMVEALWTIARESQISYIKDRYFFDNKAEFNSGGLQEYLIAEIVKSEGALAEPLLRALVLDGRFTSLGWAATRAIAKNATMLIGEQTREVKRYLRVQHTLSMSTFQRDPDQRKKYASETEHLLTETGAFQFYLQREVRKRSKMAIKAKAP
jgi:hypothetical protein